MKNRVLFIIFMFLVGFLNVNAKRIDDLTNYEYERVSKYLNNDEIEIVSDELIDMFVEEDIIASKNVIVATTYYRNVGQLPKALNTEIVAETYNSDIILDARCSFANDYIVECNTDYKYLRLTVSRSNGITTFHLYNQWLQMPKYKSFDLLGMRWTGGFTRTSQSGNQYTNGNSGDIMYLSGNGNFKIGTSGVGLSQNLVDSATQIENELIVRGTCTTGGTIYASYQHAQANITLATSKKYNFSTSGMAGVFGFYDGVGSYYDNTPGLEIHYTC